MRIYAATPVFCTLLLAGRMEAQSTASPLWVTTSVDGDSTAPTAPPTGDGWLAVRMPTAADDAGWGIAVPTDDALREARAVLNTEIERAWCIAPAAGRARMAPVAAPFFAERLTVAARNDNRAARLRAACLLARVEFELRHRDAARAVLRDVLRLHPDAMLDPVEHPPYVVELVRVMLAEQRTAPTATLTSIAGRVATHAGLTKFVSWGRVVLRVAQAQRVATPRASTCVQTVDTAVHVDKAAKPVLCAAEVAASNAGCFSRVVLPAICLVAVWFASQEARLRWARS